MNYYLRLVQQHPISEHITLDVRALVDTASARIVVEEKIVVSAHSAPLRVNVTPYHDRERWSRFVRQLAKVDLPMRRMIHYEDAETVFV